MKADAMNSETRTRPRKPFPFTASPILPRTLEMIAAQIESGNLAQLIGLSSKARNSYFESLERQLNDPAVTMEDPVLARACRADVCLELGRCAEARSTATSILREPEVSPRASAIAYCVLALLERSGARKSIQRRRRELYQQALVHNPTCERAILMLADHLWNDDGNYEGACELLERTIERRPSRVLYQDLAFIATLKGDWSRVRVALRAGESFAPLETTDSCMLARAAAHLGHYAEALDLLRRASEAPENRQFAEGKTSLELAALWQLAEEAISALERAPEDLERATQAALCVELLPAPCKQCVYDAIANKIDARSDGHFELRVERALVRINRRLMELEAYTLVPVVYPLPSICAGRAYEPPARSKPTLRGGH